jgi:hypothetical protein
MQVKTSILGIFSPTQFLKNTPAGFSVIFGAKIAKKLNRDMQAGLFWAQASPALCVFDREAVQWVESEK